jgi:hypothetical protein
MKGSSSSLGYTQITNLTAAVGLGAIPAGVEEVLLQPEAQNVRWRDDGTNPTASVGMRMIADTLYSFSIVQLAQLKFIEETASAKLNISFYGRS